MKRFILLLTAVLLIFCGCSKADEDESLPVYLPDNPSSVSLYTDGSPSPFLAQTKDDKIIVSLVYDGLVAIDNDFSVKNLLAESYFVSGNLLTVTLRENVSFSDGTHFDGNSLIYSVSKLSGTEYHKFSDIVTETALISPYCVQFTLSFVPHDLETLLTFPIVNEHSNGVGAYKFANDSTLVPNENYYGAKGTISEISLVTGDKTELFNNKKITLLYNGGDLSYGEIDKANPLKTISTNKLTFLGINKYRKLFSKADYRHALSSIIDRTYLASFAPQGNGYVSFSVINPSWYKFDSTLVSSKYSTADAKDVLSSAGLSGASVNIVVNSENVNRLMIARSLADTLEELGAKATVSSLAWDDYLAAISAGAYDIYVGETLLPNDMDVSALLPEYASYTDSQLISSLDENMPVIPLFFDQETLLTNGVFLSADEPLLTVCGYK
ncbi:MAG: ABC transporter substrate-binding protein [Clostridia bacterium]|nr:ABC transporter substrate-binding protein [Clostridia bacterium]